MIRSCLALCACCIASLAAVAQGVALPKGSPPTFVVVAKIDETKQTLEVSSTVIVPVTETRTVKVVVDGKEMDVVQTVLLHVTQTRQSLHSFASIQVSDASGKKFASPEGFNRLTVGQVVLQTQDPAGLDPAYRALFAKDTLILAPAAAPAPK